MKGILKVDGTGLQGGHHARQPLHPENRQSQGHPLRYARSHLQSAGLSAWGCAGLSAWGCAGICAGLKRDY